MIDTDKLAFKNMLVALFSINNKPTPDKDIMRMWWHKLERFEFKVVGRAFDTWTDTPSKLPQPAEIVALCRPREQEYKALPPPVSKSDNKLHSVDLVKLANESVGKPRDMKDWARKIIANPQNYPDISLRIAKEALNNAN